MSVALPLNLVLIGGRGCGKSSVSRRIQARDKRFSLLSLDTLIRYEAGGRTIPEIVAAEGWRGFRDIEAEVVRKAGAIPGGALLDAGGGVVVDLDAAGREIYAPAKVAALRAHGRVVYLERDPQRLWAKIAADPNRPALSDDTSFLELMERRDAWYRRAAHHTLDCRALSKKQIVERVLAWFYAELSARDQPSAR